MLKLTQHSHNIIFLCEYNLLILHKHIQRIIRIIIKGRLNYTKVKNRFSSFSFDQIQENKGLLSSFGKHIFVYINWSNLRFKMVASKLWICKTIYMFIYGCVMFFIIDKTVIK